MTERRRLAESSEVKGRVGGEEEGVWMSEKTLLIQPPSRKNSGEAILTEEDEGKRWLTCSRTGTVARHSAPSIEVKSFPEKQISTKCEEKSCSSATSSPSPGLAPTTSGQFLVPNSPGSDRERSYSVQHCIVSSTSTSQSKIKQQVIAGLERTPSIPAVLISKVRDRIQDKVIHTSKWQAVAAVVQERRQRAANDYIVKNSSSKNSWHQIQQKIHQLQQQQQHAHRHQNQCYFDFRPHHNSAQSHDTIEMESFKNQKSLTRVKSDPSQQQQEVLVVSGSRRKRDGSVASSSGFLDEGIQLTSRSSITSDQFPSKLPQQGFVKMSKSTSISGSRFVLGEIHRNEQEGQGVVCSGADFEDILSNYNSCIKPLLTSNTRASTLGSENLARSENENETPMVSENQVDTNLEFDPQIMGDTIEVYLEHKVCRGRRKRHSHQTLLMKHEKKQNSFDDDDNASEKSLDPKVSGNCVHIFNFLCSFASEKSRRGS